MVIESILVSTGIATTAGAAILTLSSSARKKVLRAIRRPPPYKVMGPLVSVVVPTLNEEDYIAKCLKSVQNQTYQNIETVVSDSFSTDKTVDIAEDFGSKVTFSKKNISAARNKGAEKAKGNILLFLDADSILEHRYIEKMVEALQDNFVLSHGGVCIYDDKFHSFLWTITSWAKPWFYTSGRGICISKKAFWKVGGYDEALDPLAGYREDLDLGRKVLKEFGVMSSIKYYHTVMVGTSARREKVVGYPVLDFPWAWKVRGVRKGKIIQ